MDNGESYACDRLLIGASGSIGIVNLPAYLVVFRKLRLMREVKVIMTEPAAHFIPASTIELFADGVYTDLSDRSSAGKVLHLELARWAELFVILPASADLIGKAAHGIATDLLSTTILGAESPLVFLPNMNPVMYNKRSVQRNVRLLQEDGHLVIEPEIQQGYVVSAGGVVETMSLPQPGVVAARLAELAQQRKQEDSSIETG